jgi:NitT/TauT family transport system ATP-binding protein
MAYIEVEGLSKSYSGESGASVPILASLDLQVRRGELLAVLGPNGSGKTTFLRILAGLIEADAGRATIDGRPPREARIGLMLQNYAASLFPWLTNLDNIAFALDETFGARRQKREYVRRFVQDMDLGDVPLRRYPYQCSGGQQQLVALARELAYRPDVLLLDEPFAALDYERRIQQHNHLLRLWQKTGATIVLVSHDVDDALFLADRVVLFSHRPASIAGVFEIALPRPRRIEVQAEQEYATLRSALLQRFLAVLRDAA